jgi:hypothetical protein
MTEDIRNNTGASEARARAGFALESAGLNVPGVESGVEYVGFVSREFPAMSQIEQTWANYEAGLDMIRASAEMTDDERLDRAEELYEAASTRYQQLVAQLSSERAERLASIDRSLFGGPGVGTMSLQSDAAQETTKHSFREGLVRLQGASEEDLGRTVELAKLSGDTVLARAARVVAHQSGFESVVVASLVGTQDSARYAERQAMPTEGTLRTITNQYSPAGANLPRLQPDLETRQRAEEQRQAQEARRQRRRLGLG